MEPVVVAIACVMVYVVMRVLHLAEPSAPPILHFTNSPFNHALIQACSLLKEMYVPPLLWGKSGHIQTIVYGKLGRIKSPFPQGQRCYTIMEDGTTSTFDIFEPLQPHPSRRDHTLLVCPGLANSSQSLYICTFVHYAQNHGYRVAVLNHLGSLPDVPLTTPRIFTYGGTEEYGAMVMEMQKRYPGSEAIGVGFSMGANIVCKYLGETDSDKHKLLAGISCCQGYSAATATPYYASWKHFRRVYNYAMTRHQQTILRCHRDVLFSPAAQEKYGALNPKEILAATCLADLDELYSRRTAGYPSRDDYYTAASCDKILDKIHVPMLLLNALDDPLVPEVLLKPAKDFTDNRDNVVMVVTTHGGHLGYFEGSSWAPHTLTWMDKMVIQYADAVTQILRDGVISPKEAKTCSDSLDLKNSVSVHCRDSATTSL